MMEIKGNPKEIADLVLAIQNRQEKSFTPSQGVSLSDLRKSITNSLSKVGNRGENK